MMSRQLLLTVIAAVGTLLLSGCSGTGKTYVADEQSGTFFTVPQDWTVYETDAVLDAYADIDRGDDGEFAQSVSWAVALDAAPEPSLDHVFLFGVDDLTDYPTGLSFVRMLSPQQRDTFTFQSLRNQLLPIDRVLQDNRGELLASEQVSGEDGAQGTRIVIEVNTAEGDPFVWDQTAVVDADFQSVHLLVLGCRVNCYEHHADAINAVADSWTVVEENAR